MAMEAILGIDVEVVYGYPGTAEILLDIERGALDGRAQREDRFCNPKQLGREKLYQSLGRYFSPARFPLAERADPGRTRSSRQKTPVRSHVSVQGRTFGMPPGVPAERAKILRDAFAAMFKDKEFQQDVDKLGWNDELIRGEDLNKKVDALVHNESAMGFFRKILQ